MPVIERADRLDLKDLGGDASLLQDGMDRIGLEFGCPICPELLGCQELSLLDHGVVELCERLGGCQ